MREVTESLRADLRQAQEDYGRAMAEVGRLAAMEEQHKQLETRVQSLLEAETQQRARADQLAQELTMVRRRLVWRTAALEILLIGVASITAVIWLTRWWPWS